MAGATGIGLLPKLCGADIELGNFITGRLNDEDTCLEAAVLVLNEIGGLPLPRVSAYARSGYAGSGEDGTYGRPAWNRSYGTLRDWNRRFLPANGGCAYIDLSHLELCLPEVRRALDHVACWHALLRMTRQAMERANAMLPDGERIEILVNNSDGFGNSYGSHLNFLVTREAWDTMLRRKVQYAMMLAAYQVSSILFTGQGKVGCERSAWRAGEPVGAAEVPYQISQRADFFEEQLGEQTSVSRPLVNTRDEPLCGPYKWSREAEDPRAREMARLHVIFYDSTLCHGASFLKVGVLQVILAMMEAGFLDRSLILDDPLEALRLWSRDLSLEARARTEGGEELTALELQFRFLEHAKEFVAERLVFGDRCNGIVPQASRIVELWEDTLVKLENRDFTSLARRLDWVLKLAILRRALEQHPHLTWQSPELKHLDLAYGNLDSQRGLYWAYERAGVVERLVDDNRIDWFTRHPPEDTRAWGRTMLLRLANAASVERVDWDSIEVVSRDAEFRKVSRELSMPNPLGFTRQALQGVLRSATPIEGILDDLGARSTLIRSEASVWTWC
ncbi:MAG: proteasome accessory factor PafA2 family protein [Planctomycetota bacterium]